MMSFVEQLLGWAIVVMLVIGSVVAADPFWGPRRGKRASSTGTEPTDRADSVRAD